MKDTTLCNSRVAMILIIIALICFTLTLLTLIENNPKHEGAAYGFMMFASIFGIPGFWLCFRGRRIRKHELFSQQLSGYFKSHDCFTVAEMAKKIGKTEMETEALIFNLIDDQKTDLVFHRGTRQYFHKNRIDKNYHQIDRCSSCAANLKQEIVFDGETIICQYCGHRNN